MFMFYFFYGFKIFKLSPITVGLIIIGIYQKSCKNPLFPSKKIHEVKLVKGKLRGGGI